nr:hypothetical protein [Halorientalis persicus]
MNLLVCELSFRFGIVFSRFSLVVNNLIFRADSRDGRPAIVDFFDDEVGTDSDEFADLIVEAITPRSGEH